jgi:hypothetical protein
MNEEETSSQEAIQGTVNGAAQSPAGSTPPLSGANQPQAQNNGQGVATVVPVNITPWIFAGLILIGIIIAVRR